jgi:hypothetical protein
VPRPAEERALSEQMQPAAQESEPSRRQAMPFLNAQVRTVNGFMRVGAEARTETLRGNENGRGKSPLA